MEKGRIENEVKLKKNNIVKGVLVFKFIKEKKTKKYNYYYIIF